MFFCVFLRFYAKSDEKWCFFQKRNSKNGKKLCFFDFRVVLVNRILGFQVLGKVGFFENSQKGEGESLIPKGFEWFWHLKRH